MNGSFLRAMALTGILGLAACQGAGISNSGPLPDTPVNAQQPAAEQSAAQQASAQPPSELSGGETGTSASAGAGSPPGADGVIPLRSADAVRRVCPQARQDGEMECLALERMDLRTNDLKPDSTHYGYGPADLQSAYSVSGTKSSLVAAVAAYGYPNASSDLANYRSSYGLPACTTRNGCLKIVNQTGGSKPPKTNQSWDAEQALDLDMISAMCPKCKILLVEANTSYSSDLYASVSEAAKLGAAVISNSYGAGERSGCGGAREKSDSAFSAAGHIYVASAGDNGGGSSYCGGPEQPCSFAAVVCVGGTILVHARNARGWKESVWNELADYECSGSCGGTGSGCSTVVSKPAWQTDTGCKMRSEADVAAEASVLTPVAVYFGAYGGWTAFGGTSVAAPIIGGIAGRAGNGKSGNGPKNVWAHRSQLHDQTVGNNLYQRLTGNCASSVRYICYAAKGYDGPTGLGSPNGLGAF